jgi:iron complex outermembrane receptor protein
MAQSSLSTSSGASQGQSPLGVPGVARSSLSSQREAQASVGARWRQPLGQAHTLSLGIDVDEKHRRELRRQFDDGFEQFTGSVGVPFTAVTQRTTAFGQDEWAMAEGWSSMLGLRAETTRLVTGAPSGEVASTYSVLSPVLHLRHALDDKGRDLVRASVARSIRVPEIGLLLPRYSLNGSYDRDTPNTPLAADSAGNPRLQPEYSTGFDLALEQHLRSGGVLSASVFHRRLDGLIRRRIALETVAEASVPRWVSRPTNLGSARTTGIELELKGQGDEMLKSLWPAAPKTLQLRAALSVYRSSVEQIDDPDARLEGQPPWTASLGMDHTVPATGITYGSNFTLTPAFSTQQTDRQRVWRSAARRLDAYLLWRFDRLTNVRLAVNNALPADSLSTSQIDALDGTSAGSASRRKAYTQYTANLQWRF